MPPTLCATAIAEQTCVFVSSPEQIDPQKFGALAARNRGASVDAFTDFHAAEEWLLK
jgi:hypothetical protein